MALARDARAAVTLVYVRHAPVPVLGDPYQRALSDDLAQVRAILDEAPAEVSAGGVDVETEVFEGNPDDGIELARLRAVDLIVLGSRGRGASAGLLGSVSEGVVHRADWPVLVVKPRSKTGRRAARSECGTELLLRIGIR